MTIRYPAALFGALLAASALTVHASTGQINSFNASALDVSVGTVVDFTVDFGVITEGWTNGGSNPIEPAPQEGFQEWQVNWYSYEKQTLSQVWFEAGGNTFTDFPSPAPNSSYSGLWTFSLQFPTEGTFSITVNGGWTTSFESYRSNENATRDCYNIDPGGTDELSCSPWNWVYDDGGDTYTFDQSFSPLTLTVNVAAVPEPESLAMLLAGVGVLVGARRLKPRP
jgi:hypothetical protein